MSSAPVNVVLKRMQNGKYHGYMVAHGFRSMTSTILNENKFDFLATYDIILTTYLLKFIL